LTTPGDPFIERKGKNMSRRKTISDFSQHAVLVRFLFILLPLLVLTGMVLYLIYMTDLNTNISRLKRDALHTINMQREVIASELRSVASDLMTLSEHSDLLRMVDLMDEENRRTLAESFLNFSRRKGLYDQIRFLDETGMEIVRVNYNKGNPYIVPDAQLQSKSRRYYFRDIFNLAKGEVFVSPFDLSVEQGEIENPLKPVIRFGTPVFNSRGEKKGIIVLNYLGENILRNVKVHIIVPRGDILLLNPEGFYLKATVPGDEWGFMFEDKKEIVFGKFYPEEWRKIIEEQSGQFRSPKGIFTFTTVYPLSEGMKSSTGSGSAFEPSTGQVGHREYFYKIVFHLSKPVLKEEARSIGSKYILFLGIIFVIVTLGSYSIALVYVKRRVAEAETERSINILKVLNSLLRLSLEDTPLEDMLDRALDLILSIQWLAIESKGAIFTVDESFQRLTMKVHRGFSEQVIKSCSTIPFGMCLCVRAAQTGEIQFASAIDDRHELRYEGIEPHGHYCVPIMYGDEMQGVLNLYVKEGHVRVEREEAFLKAVADTLSGMIKRKRMEYELERLAVTDRLTQAYNRTKFEEVINLEMERSRRYGRVLSMAILDIDHFKEVNDIYGHLAGDCVLRELSYILRENIRKTDSLFRWGGEEFVIIFTETNLELAGLLAERIRRLVEIYRFEKAGNITISFGVTQYREGDSEDDIIKRADDALYRAKKRGRNRVEVI
jgi:diguanylate cyclase (GGDEF)-like protein